MDPYTQLSKRQKRRRVQKGLLEANADVTNPPIISQGGSGGAILMDADEQLLEENSPGPDRSRVFCISEGEEGNDDTEDYVSCFSDLDSLIDRLLDNEFDARIDSYSEEETDEDEILVDNIIRADVRDEGSLDANDVEPCNLLRQLLAQWASVWWICHNAVDALLNLLRMFSWESSLPKSARTLLKTPRFVVTRTVLLGKYSHIGILQGIKEFLGSNVVKNVPEIIELFVGADGLPISKSSGVEFWPIVGMMTLTCVPFVFTIGLYEGVGKPKDLNLFYRKFVEEILLLEREGFEWEVYIEK